MPHTPTNCGSQATQCCALLLAALLLAGCAAPHPLATWEEPLPKTQFQHVRTTAYFDGEADHLRYTNHNALGSTLRYGHVNSAAADWGRWPAGTMFRILQTGETFVVDDYGWAIAGTNTIDLYKPSRRLMNDWGVRHVDIQILQWGDPRLSYDTLASRSGYRHVDRMLKELRPQLDSVPPAYVATIPSAALPTTASARNVERATPLEPYQDSNGTLLRPFNSTW
jgi:3D (Asp-Asp-Asp) domain-containing protein